MYRVPIIWYLVRTIKFKFCLFLVFCNFYTIPNRRRSIIEETRLLAGQMQSLTLYSSSCQDNPLLVITRHGYGHQHPLLLARRRVQGQLQIYKYHQGLLAFKN